MTDTLLVARVFDAFWAPREADPQAPAVLLDDDEPLTNNDVIRARRAWLRIARTQANADLDATWDECLLALMLEREGTYRQVVRENKRLREALKRFGGHTSRCTIVLDDYGEHPPCGCACGYDAALRASGPRAER